MMFEYLDDKKYTVSDFNGSQIFVPDDKEVAVEKKIELLKDLCLLAPNSKKKTQTVRALLQSCDNEQQMTILLHNVLRGDKTLDELLQQKGLM